MASSKRQIALEFPEIFWERHDPPLSWEEMREQSKNRLKYQKGYPVLFQEVDAARTFYEVVADSTAADINLKGHAYEELPGYQRAKESAESKYHKVLATRYPRDFVILPELTEEARRENFFSWLGLETVALTVPSHIELIRKAAKVGDEGFFLRMSEVMKARHERKWPTSPQIFMAFHWVKCLMWLMTDSVGWIYLRERVYCVDPASYEVTLDAYTKTKQRLKLYQHSKPPINGITADGKLLVT